MGKIFLREIIEEISMGPFGSDIKVDNYISEGVPVLNGSNLEGTKLNENSFNYVSEEKAITLKKANAKRGDIVITHRGTLGQISYIPENSKYDNYVISQSQFRVRLKKDLADPVYLVYYFHTSEGQKRLLANKCHVGVPALAQATTNFKLIEIILPPLHTQKKIAAVLSTLDAKIELNQRMNAELEAMAKTLYDYWFVQYDFPDKNGKPYKSSGGKMVWNAELKREVPEGWEVGTINDFGEIITGGTPSTVDDDNFCENGTAWITPKDLSDTENKYIKKGGTDITHKGLKTSSAKLMPAGSVLLTTRAPIGYLAIARNEVTTNQGFKSIVPKAEFGSEYVYYTIHSIVPKLQILGVGSTFREISKEVFSKVPVALPPSEIIQEFKNVINALAERKMQSEDEIHELISVRDWLLPLLMNGQVRVKGAGVYEMREEELGMVAEGEIIISKIKSIK